jgi:undecaprenyl-diphosphatase
MSLLPIIVLAIVQGLAELLPISSSAHVIVAEKMMGLDPSSPPMTLLLVMLHTGTMFAVITYFWRQWRSTYFQSLSPFRKFAGHAVLATVLTRVIGEGCIKIIEKTIFPHVGRAQIEDLFSHLELIAPALAAAGVLILIAGIVEKRIASPDETKALNAWQAALIGAVQGLCLPFRGFSRSGATISTGILAGVAKRRARPSHPLRDISGDRPSRAFTVRAIRKHLDAPMAIGQRSCSRKNCVLLLQFEPHCG